MTHPAIPDPFAGLDPNDYVLTFAPAPTRKHRSGWTAERQRRFILALRCCGVVATAARSVGFSTASAYQLRAKAGGQSFAEAWDRALDEARGRAFDMAVDRAVNGYVTPLFYRGRYTGLAHRYDSRLAMAALSYADRTEAKRDK